MVINWPMQWSCFGIARGTWVDKVSQGAALGFASLQIYFVGLVLQFIFVNKLNWLPTPGYTSPLHYPLDWAKQMALPWITLAFLLSAIYSRLIGWNDRSYERRLCADCTGERFKFKNN
jgi:ABC-type dipeptide/oligopeptide/nickel transport system permease component